jgi:hypothetical protein
LERSTAIRKIEQDMIELARLYQEVAELVQQQEPAVEQINQGAHDVVENVDNANKQIDSAIVSARNARRWKWYILIAVSKYCLYQIQSPKLEANFSQSSLLRLSSVSPLVLPKPTSLKRTLSADADWLNEAGNYEYPGFAFFFSIIIPITQCVQL